MPRAQRIAAREFTIACSVCGQLAIRVCPIAQSRGILKAILSDAEFICEGITRSFALRADGVERVFAWLRDDDLAALHRYILDEADVDGGLDAYCPECDQIYCREHYNVVEEWDEGFYDDSRGTCPSGHTRLVDD
jgi:hypothetical protein